MQLLIFFLLPYTAFVSPLSLSFVPLCEISDFSFLLLPNSQTTSDDACLMDLFRLFLGRNQSGRKMRAAETEGGRIDAREEIQISPLFGRRDLGNPRRFMEIFLHISLVD